MKSCCFFLTSVKLVTTCTFMFSIPFRNEIFITHLQKCTQTICLVFMGDVERFENMLCFLSHLHRGMDLLWKSFFKKLFVLLCPFFKCLRPTKPLFPFLSWCNSKKTWMFLHIYFSHKPVSLYILWENPTGLQSLNFQKILLLLSVHV